MRPPGSVVLFNPRSVRRVGSHALPMGCIMAAINLYKTHKVVIIDQSVDATWRERLLACLREHPVCLGISSMTGRQITEGLQAARLARDHQCPVVWGGLHPSLMPEQTLAHPLVDYVVEGAGEETFAELVRALETGSDVSAIPGVWSKREGASHYGGPRPFPVLDQLPDIPYHIVEVAKYLRHSTARPTLSLYSSRGCPQRCRFCYNRAVHKSQWRCFSALRTLEEIRRIRRDNPELMHLEFWDDSFFPDLNRARDIAEGIAQIRPRLTWSVLGAHVRDIVRMDDACLDFFHDSGLTDVVIGAESGSQRIIDLVQKNFRLDQLLESNRRLARCNIRPTYTFISGIPGETDDDIRETSKLLFHLKKDNPDAILGNVKPFVPYPGTELYQTAVDNGFKPPQRLEEWSRFVWGNYTHLDIPWVSKARRKRLNDLYFYTVAMSPEYLFIESKLFTLLARAILPLTRWRVRHLCFLFPIEARIMAWTERRLL